MKMRLNWLACSAMSLIFFPSLQGQAVYTATRSTTIQAGGGYLILRPDYTELNIKGISFWGDYDIKRWIGAEFSGHLGSIITPGDVSEDTYLIGPRLMYHKHKLTAYGKILIGRASFSSHHNGATLTSSSYTAFGLGGGIEYRATRRVNIRALDIEVQKWPDFQPNSLSPVTFSFGASYIIK